MKSLWTIIIVFLSIFFAGCAGVSKVDATKPQQIQPSFALMLTPANLDVAQGGSTTSTISVDGKNGFDGSVTLSATGLPAGISASFQSNSKSSSVITLTAAQTAIPGLVTATIRGVSGNLTSSATLNLTVVAAPYFELSASPADLSVARGNAATSVITVTPQAGFDGSVSLSAEGLPSGVTASFDPASTSNTSVLTLTVDSTMTPGTTTVTVSGSSGVMTASTEISLTVTAPPVLEITLSASPSSVSIDQGSSGATTITITPSGTSDVSLSASGLPTGVIASFSPATTRTTSTLTFEASASAITGDAVVTITGTAGSQSPTTTFLLTVVATTSPISLEVLFPPTNPFDPNFTAVQAYLMNNSYVSGAVFAVNWSDFDLGSENTGTHTAYDFTITDAVIQPWIDAGKKVNFTMQSATYGGSVCPSRGPGSNGTVGSNCALPGWMWTALTASNYTTCDGQQVPNWRSSTFQSNYKAAIAELLKHYGSNPAIGYIRIGLGRGGEINLPKSWQDTTQACGIAYTNTWGYTVGSDASFTWNGYLRDMLNYEGGANFSGQKSPKQLLVSITPVTGTTGKTVPDFLAPIAVSLGIGFGNQGLQSSDIDDCPHAGADWCQLFTTYAGQVPLELQTFGQSCPAGVGNCPDDLLSNKTGSLVPLLPWAVKSPVTILELYYQDWLIAYHPNYPGYNQYGAAYAAAIQAAATSR